MGTNPKFTGFALELAKIVAENDPADVDALKACAMGESTVDAELTEMIHVIGENMKIARFARHRRGRRPGQLRRTWAASSPTS